MRIKSSLKTEAGKEGEGQVTFAPGLLFALLLSGLSHYGLQKKSKCVIYNPCLIGQNTPSAHVREN